MVAAWVDDQPKGFTLRVERDPAVTAVLAPGVARCGGTFEDLVWNLPKLLRRPPREQATHLDERAVCLGGTWGMGRKGMRV